MGRACPPTRRGCSPFVGLLGGVVVGAVAPTSFGLLRGPPALRLPRRVVGLNCAPRAVPPTECVQLFKFGFANMNGSGLQIRVCEYERFGFLNLGLRIVSAVSVTPLLFFRYFWCLWLIVRCLRVFVSAAFGFLNFGWFRRSVF